MSGAEPAVSSAVDEAPAECLLEARDIRKAFPGVVALDGVSLKLHGRSVHALMGENGAGKSTLMKIIAGIYAPDAGELRLRGRAVRFASPREALQQGIAMIHQELNLLPSMSVAENVWIGREPLRLGLVSHRELRRRTRELLERLHIDLDPDAEVRRLSIAARQLVEIARALSYESDLLIMDEPTSALTERDAEQLFGIVRGLRAAGKGILYITHRMEELTEIADQVSVLRDGRHVGTARAEGLSRDEIIRMMVGRTLERIFPHEPAQPGAVALSVSRLTLPGHFHDVSFELRFGEILGVAGLVGCGRSKLAEAIFGLTPASGGQIRIGGREVRIDSPRTSVAHGMGFVTEDRKETGCFLPLDVLENLAISVLSRKFVRAGFVRGMALRHACGEMLQRLRVKTPDLNERIENLSGGNQQKVLLGRWLLLGPRILILDEPTRGVDVGAKAEIHQLISRLVGQGMGVLM
ncbi:MAG: sugar ABC transporter ATP-binding protein, partial [Gammaproteobacteria bacterium]|nr:sugar ABC transporter ATP-binding protein [Gammaproteobacteria bacterium]